MFFKRLIHCFLLSTTPMLPQVTKTYRPPRIIDSYSFSSMAQSFSNSTSNIFNEKQNNSNNDGDELNFLYRLRDFEGYGLDTNCHHGKTTFELQSKYPELKVYGIDGSKNNIKIAQKKYMHNNFIPIDFECYTGIPHASFSVVQVQNYKNLMLNFLKSLHILEDNGLLILHCNDIEDLSKIRRYLDANKTVYLKKMLNMTLSYHVIDKTIYLFK